MDRTKLDLSKKRMAEVKQKIIFELIDNGEYYD